MILAQIRFELLCEQAKFPRIPRVEMAEMDLKFKVNDPYFRYQPRVSHDAYYVQFGDSSDELFPQTSRIS